jgi:hypothetical protein
MKRRQFIAGLGSAAAWLNHILHNFRLFTPRPRWSAHRANRTYGPLMAVAGPITGRTAARPSGTGRVVDTPP